MRSALLLVALVGCTRTPPQPAPETRADADLLATCKREVESGATLWDCGDALLALDARVDGAQSPAAIEDNLKKLEESFAGHVVARDPSDWQQSGQSHRALRIRVDLPEKGRFVAKMIVVARTDHARVLSCSGKESADARCDEILRQLVAAAIAP